uniref:VWFD domain-containing protein n=1 Tax=Salarias fasciatus TaxID=181472 RepID=A0A672F6J5_SALFA
CPANSHFESQGTGCPPTCVNPNFTEDCPLPARESCVCNAGYVLSAGVCVPHAECGCSFEGRYYSSGETVILGEDCGRRCSCSYGSMTCSSHACGPHESCSVEEGERGCRPNSYATCWIRGPGSYQTFDKLTYRYPGACRLTLAKVMGTSSHPHFMVTAEKVPRIREGFIQILNFEVDSQLIKLPYSSASNRIQIYHSSLHSVTLRTSFGVTVQTVWPHFVQVTAPSVYAGSLGGLCGNYNGHPHDDFRTPNGFLVNSSQTFGDSWRDGSLSAHCVENLDEDTENNHNVSEYCGILTSPQGPFAPCWSTVDPQQQVHVCEQIIQGSEDPASKVCEVLRDYALMCQQNGVVLEEWRNVTGCELACPANSHYELCGDSCPSACPSLSFPFTCNTQCQEGCQCDDGFVLNGNQCVPPTSCGCYHQGRYRHGGEQFKDGEECQSLCTCNGTTGTVHCVPSSCGPQESCRVVEGVFGCHPKPHGTCYASGDPHYKTFDGMKYDFQGTCRYILAKDCNATGLRQFSVEAKNEPWNGQLVSVTAEPAFMICSVILQVDGIITNLPVVLNGSRVTIFVSGSRTFVNADFGLSVTFDGRSTVFITLPSDFRGKTCGLCGNFNGNSSDDFDTPSGTVTSPDEFGAAWKVAGNYSCSDGCGSSCPRCTDEQPARDQCQVIRAADGPFSFCHDQVDPAPFFSDCVFDVCVSGSGGPDLLCQAIEAYVSACQSANVPIFPWRQNTTCRLDCPANSHYELCGTDCGHTCASSPDATCEHVCSEGCFCDEGFLRSGTQCVPMESCGCQYDGFYYNAGDSFWTDGCSQRCKCHAPNDLRCSAASCILDQRCTIKNGLLGCFDAMSTCTVWGDPHYVSFDGALSHFQGTCSYIITESVRHRANETQFRVIGTNNHRGNNLVSFVSAVDVYLSNHPESVHVRIGPNRRINGSAVSLPTIAGTLAQLERQGNFIVVNAGDLVVQFDGQSTLLVRTAENRKNRLTGMCGNANNDPADDKVFPNGTLAVNDNELLCLSRCGSTDERITDQLSDLTNVEGYSALCSIITNTSGPFAACHPHSDPRPFFSSCVYDLCLYTTANGMLCSAVAAYERTCAVAGVNVSEWRSGLSCGISSASSAGVPVQLGDSFWSDGTCAERCTCTSEGLQCQSQPCSFSQICRPAAFQFSCQTIQRRTCTIVGDPHYYTFDNQVFHFQGTCTYVLSEQCGSALPYYRVEGKNEHRGSTRVSWVRLVKVTSWQTFLLLCLQVNGDFVSTPISLNNGTVQVYQSGFFVVINTDFGLEVSYDTNHHVRISVPLNYRNSTCGLCGNFNNRPEDDFRTRQGEIVSSDVDFANSWRASGDDEPSCNVRCGGLDCSGCTAEQTELYSTTAHCGIIQSSSGPFAACHQQHPPQRFVESCVYDLCVGGGYQPFLCQAIEAYATQCQQNGVQVSWRRPGFCEIPCPANSHFESQGTGCPPTCVNPNFTEDCPLPARESCVCNAGYVLSAGVCVPHAECGCSFEGRYYSSGETVILREDCGRRCSCSYGSMTCSSHACGPHESCSVEEGERGCRPNSYATCWIRGPGSYQTFDKLTYRYPGACRLTLAKVMGTSSHPHFMVTAEKVPRVREGFIRILNFEAEGTQISIEMSMFSHVQVRHPIKVKHRSILFYVMNTENIHFNIFSYLQVDSQLIKLPYSSASNRIQIYHSSLHSVTLRTSFGVTVQTVWPHFVQVTAPSVYAGSLGGLCGNYNGHPRDDFHTPNGVLVNISQAFGDSWRDGSLSAHCVENLDEDTKNNHNVSEYCGILTSPQGPFAPCWSTVDPHQQVHVCEQIIQGSEDPASKVCEVLRDYALMCQQNGVVLEEWRNVTGCGKCQNT